MALKILRSEISAGPEAARAPRLVALSRVAHWRRCAALTHPTHRATIGRIPTIKLGAAGTQWRARRAS